MKHLMIIFAVLMMVGIAMSLSVSPGKPSHKNENKASSVSPGASAQQGSIHMLSR